jgi:HTH-type transcriptional regulator / antitoxin HigA
VATTIRPAEAFSPGEFLREELEERGWTQADLAEIMGRPLVLVNEIIAGKRGITAETARGLSAAFGTSPELWMRLESAWQLSKAGSDEPTPVAQRARVYGRAPIREMQRRNWIEQTSNADVLERQLLNFLGTKTLDEHFQLRYAASKSTSYAEPLTQVQEVWLARAAQIAPAAPAKIYDAATIQDTIRRLKMLLHSEREVPYVPRALADGGIRLVIVQPLPGSKMDGVTFWLSKQEPVIALTLRLDRIDNFWFVLMHEMAHVKNGGALSIDDDIMARQDQEDLPPHERKAVEYARETLIPSHQLESFISRVGPLYSTRSILAFATNNNVHPALVVGQLQHRGEIPWSNFRRTMVPIKSLITPNATTDGWGTTVPIRK